jgi:hypothetical protein
MITEQQASEIHAALVGNGLNNEIAHFLVALVERISRLEDWKAIIQPEDRK